jgi:hypothetical protein
MANVNSTQQAASVGQLGNALAGLQLAWATYEIGTALSAADTITFMTLPAGTTVHGGFLIGDDLDTGTETLEIDVGDASDTDRFLDSGVLTGDAVTGIKPEVGIYVPLAGVGLRGGGHTYTSATAIIGTITAAAAAGGTGTISLKLFCTYQDPRVSPPDAPV